MNDMCLLFQLLEECLQWFLVNRVFRFCPVVHSSYTRNSTPFHQHPKTTSASILLKYRQSLANLPLLLVHTPFVCVSSQVLHNCSIRRPTHFPLNRGTLNDSLLQSCQSLANFRSMLARVEIRLVLHQVPTGLHNCIHIPTLFLLLSKTKNDVCSPLLTQCLTEMNFL